VLAHQLERRYEVPCTVETGQQCNSS
jgi:hypothetical protein